MHFERQNVRLPYLKFSDPLPKTHLFLFGPMIESGKRLNQINQTCFL